MIACLHPWTFLPFWKWNYHCFQGFQLLLLLPCGQSLGLVLLPRKVAWWPLGWFSKLYVTGRKLCKVQPSPLSTKSSTHLTLPVSPSWSPNVDTQNPHEINPNCSFPSTASFLPPSYNSKTVPIKDTSVKRKKESLQEDPWMITNPIVLRTVWEYYFFLFQVLYT